MKTLSLAVIGKDVSQSTSPQMHSFIAREMGNGINYIRLSLPEEQFEGSAEGLFEKFDGFNITIPYKLWIMPHLKNIVGDAKVFGAVNTVKSADKSGYNTDGLGFWLMLKTNGISVFGKRVLVLGAGGAGRSVAYKLKENGAQVFIYDNNQQSAQAVAREFSLTALSEVVPENYYLIVNATGVGMHKSVGISPVDGNILQNCEVAVDLIYTPKKSRFLEIAESLNKKTVNGEAMLFYQAYYAQCIYFNLNADEAQAKRLFEKYSKEN